MPVAPIEGAQDKDQINLIDEESRIMPPAKIRAVMPNATAPIAIVLRRFWRTILRNANLKSSQNILIDRNLLEHTSHPLGPKDQ